MLVRPEVINHFAPLLAVNHRRVESSALPFEIERANPRHGLTSEGIAIRIVLDRKGNVFTCLREHDVTPSADIQKRHGVKAAEPNVRHDARSDRRNLRTTIKAESPLNHRMQSGKALRAEGSLVNRVHGNGRVSD